MDRLGHNATLCTAIPTLQCNHNDYPSLSCNTGYNTTVKLNGERQLLLKSVDYFESGLYFTLTHEIVDPLKDIAIKFTCVKTFIQANLHVTLTMCPLGYMFDSNMMTNLNSSGVCECVKDTNLQCSHNLGIVCVRNGFLYGTMKGDNKLLNITIQCDPPYCANRESCPLNEFSDTFMKLPTTQDDQCSGLHGGVMCRGCQKEATYTFGASKCILSSSCSWWMPYAILCSVIIFQVSLVLFIILFLKNNYRSGVGYLYCPLFFLAVNKLLSLSLVDPYVPLEILISVYHSILFLDLSIFGKIPLVFLS